MKLFRLELLLSFALVALAGAPALAQPPRAAGSTAGQLAELSFEHGSSRLVLDAATRRRLNEIVGWAVTHPEALIVLDGHADRSGASPYNVRLSLRRAQTVRDQLVELGIQPDRIMVAAFGETGPRVSARRRVIVWGSAASFTRSPDRRPRPGAVARR